MQISFLGNKDRGSAVLVSLVLLFFLVLAFFPFVSLRSKSLLYEKKQYESICNQIEAENLRMRAIYETY